MDGHDAFRLARIALVEQYHLFHQDAKMWGSGKGGKDSQAAAEAYNWLADHHPPAVPMQGT